MPRKPAKRIRARSLEKQALDKHVGGRLRLHRQLLGLSQQKLGASIGLTFQQIQKYEKGTNQISGGTLYRLSQVLEVPMTYFFEGMAGFDTPLLEPPVSRRDPRTLELADRMLMDRRILKFARAFSSIQSKQLQSSILHLVKVAADQSAAALR